MATAREMTRAKVLDFCLECYVTQTPRPYWRRSRKRRVIGHSSCRFPGLGFQALEVVLKKTLLHGKGLWCSALLTQNVALVGHLATQLHLHAIDMRKM